MNCVKMNNLLSAYLDHELTPEERRQLRLHLIDCHQCVDELRELEEIKEALGCLDVVRIPSIIPWLEARLNAGQGEEPTPVFIWQHPWFRRTCMVAALLLLFGLSSWLLLPDKNRPGQSGAFPSLPDASWISLDRIIP